MVLERVLLEGSRGEIVLECAYPTTKGGHSAIDALEMGMATLSADS